MQVNGVTTYYVGNHYEVKNSVVTKYYFAGATRLAVRTGGTLSFLLADHIGSSSVTTDANGGLPVQALYKAFGETRYTSGSLGTDYHFTGQREEVSLGIYFFNARWYDGQLGRFLSPDTIVPTQTQGTQAWDRYAFVNNNPVRYNDPTGHQIEEDKGGQKGHTDESGVSTTEASDGAGGSCSESQDGVTCDISFPEEARQPVTNLLNGAGWGTVIGYTVIGGLIGGPIGAVIGGVAGWYEMSVMADMSAEINSAINSKNPVIVSSAEKGVVGMVVDGNDDGKGPLVNTPMAFFVLDLLVSVTTGYTLFP